MIIGVKLYFQNVFPQLCQGIFWKFKVCVWQNKQGFQFTPNTRKTLLSLIKTFNRKINCLFLTFFGGVGNWHGEYLIMSNGHPMVSIYHIYNNKPPNSLVWIFMSDYTYPPTSLMLKPSQPSFAGLNECLGEARGNYTSAMWMVRYHFHESKGNLKTDTHAVQYWYDSW